MSEAFEKIKPRTLIALGAAIAAFSIFGCSQARAESYLAHPAGCPKIKFCACGAAVEIFGRPIRSLWPSTAWLRFPRSAPGYNTVAVRRGHVFVLKQRVDGDTWLVADYNSGSHKSRLHHRRISGYTVVQPQSRMAAHDPRTVE
jgi:hypothetical protein